MSRSSIAPPPFCRLSHALGPLALVLAIVLPAPAFAQPRAPTKGAGVPSLPPDIDIEWMGQFRQTADGDFLFTGPVTITWRDSRIQADRVSLRGNRYIEAEGNVLLVWSGNRIFGKRMTYDLEQQRGRIEEATGQVEGGFFFWAAAAEKIGADRIHVESATVTTCTQPVPYWSFAISSATIRLDHYARMWNVRLQVSKAPVVYLPLLVWPVKRDRAAGLLMPEFHTTETRGRSVTQELFLPLGRSADLTLLGRYYTEAGFGGGGELRLVPNRNGAASLSGFYIRDKVAGFGRYRAEYRQTQKFRNGFRMVADVNLVSDFDYFSDFERALNLVSSPTILARLELSRNGPWTSMNVRELRREQLFSDGTSLVQQTLPEVEWRGRSRRLGRSPFYLSFESSLASIQQRGQQQGQAIDADYRRIDLFPTLSAPLSPFTWLDVTPRLRYRWTHYTQSRLPDAEQPDASVFPISGSSLTRGLWVAGLELVGPKLFRIHQRPQGKFSTRFKHAIEPRISYGYAESFERPDEVILFDEVDRFSGSGNQVNYGVVQRLFAQRPRVRPEAESRVTEAIVLPDGTTSQAATRSWGFDVAVEEPQPLPREAATREPVEIATLEIRQSRSFDQDLSTADLDRDGDPSDKTSRYSDLELLGRFNPSSTLSLDLRTRYHILYRKFRDVTLSGEMRNHRAHLRLSFVRRSGLGVIRSGTTTDDEGNSVPLFVDREDDTQLRLQTAFRLLRGKLQLALDGSFDADPAPGQTHLPDRRWRVQYSTQCCTFLLERLARNFSTISDRRDFYFRIELKGVGKILDVNY